MKSKLLFSAGLALAATLAQASPVTPSYTTFGDLADATFGGTGIPTNLTAISTNGPVTVGLTAHQRYSNPLVTGAAGVFSATTGLNTGLDGGSHPLGATWNFGFYINVGDLGGTLSSYQIDLYYDTDAGVGTDFAAMGHFDLDAYIVSLGKGGQTKYEDSQNLAWVPGFNAFAAGEYSLLLRVSDAFGNATTSAINVNVADPQAVPEPGSLALAGLALAGLAAARRRRA